MTRPTSESQEQLAAQHAACKVAVTRACDVMGWPYDERLIREAINKVARGVAVAVSVEKLHAMLDRIEGIKQ